MIPRLLFAFSFPVLLAAQPADLVANALLPALAASAQTPSQAVRLTIPEPQRPTMDSTVRLFPLLANEGSTDIGVPVTIELEVDGGPYTGGQSDARWTCANHQTPFKVRCTTPQLRAGEALPVQIYIGPAAEGNFEVHGSAFWGEGEDRRFVIAVSRSARFQRDFLVTSAADAGTGSLREAVGMLNGVCTRTPIPCDVRFAIPGDPPHVVVLETPLPPIGAPDFRMEADGEAPLVIDGSRLSAGHGLDLTGFGPYAVRGVTVRNFPWDGIAVTRYLSTPNSAFLTGNTVTGNGGRGITFNGVGKAEVTNNHARGNGRSGIFLLGAGEMLVSGNRLEENGASGIFVGPSSYIRVEANRVAGNAHFGIAVHRQARVVTLTDNSVVGNALLGIDRGLDGFNGYEYDDYDLQNAEIPPQRLTSAAYDAATDTTVIRGSYFDSVDYWGRWSLTVYRNEIPGPHGDVVLGHPTVANGEFSLTVPGDLRGSYVTASGNRYLNLGWSGEHAWPSEFSEHLEVH